MKCSEFPKLPSICTRTIFSNIGRARSNMCREIHRTMTYSYECNNSDSYLESQCVCTADSVSALFWGKSRQLQQLK